MTTSHRYAYLLPLLLLSAAARATNPTFDSHSDGSDGAFDLTGAPWGTTVNFDPLSFTRPDGQPLNPAQDNVFNFTTIKIPAGVTVKMRGWSLRNKPVYWLASGAVVIDGTLDLSGSRGPARGTAAIAEPGPGGFPGGTGASAYTSPGPGGGPGGGQTLTAAQFSSQSGRGCFLGGNYSGGARAYPNPFLLPLLGGSGGAGGSAGGGAGGGAILIASSTSVSINGVIASNGGGCSGDYTFCYEGAECMYDGEQASGIGSGGAVRIMAPTITGNGQIQVGSPCVSSNEFACAYRGGHIRLEAFSGQMLFGSGQPPGAYVSALTPNPTFGLPTASSGRLQIVKVGGLDVPAGPTASFENPDLTLNSSQPLQIDLTSANIPEGTTVTVQVVSDTMGVQTLTTTLSSSAASVTAALPPGLSRIFASASWNIGG